MASKRYRPWSPEQPYLLPPSPQEWLPQGHLAYFILDVVAQLDVSGFDTAIQAKDARGTRPYDPTMMVALLLYSYCVGVFSSRRIERATYEDVAFRVLCGEHHPHFTRIAAFRREHKDAFEALFVGVLKLCRQAGLVKLGHVAIDGTKIQANASKHKAMSYGRMTALEQRLQAEVAELLARAEATDGRDDRRFGSGCRDEDLPAELRRREDRLARLRAAKAALEEEARSARQAHERDLAIGCRERAAAADTDRARRLNTTLATQHEAKAQALSASNHNDEPPGFTTSDGLPMHRPRSTPDGKPHAKAQRCFTDPDSRLMESGGAFLQGYNCQAAVDDAHQIIVAQSVTNQPPDAGNLIPMLDLVHHNIGAYPDYASADSGYWAEGVGAAAAERGTDVLVATERRRHWDRNPTRTSGPPPPELDDRQKMQWRLRTDDGRDIYSRRKVIVEPVFGQIKDGRGFGRFLMRGLALVGLEWSLLSTTHNLLKLFRAAVQANRRALTT